jgi:glycerophosphoryl diester phosphodiesterase
VAHTSFKEIEALHAEIPTLTQLLDWFQSSTMLMNLELKYPDPLMIPWPASHLVHIVGDALSALPFETQNRILLSSFNLDALCLARKRLPHTAMSLLIDHTVLTTWTLPRIKEILQEVNAYSLHCDKALLHQAELRDTLMTLSPRVLAYTVNSLEEAYLLFHYGVCAVFSDQNFTHIKSTRDFG